MSNLLKSPIRYTCCLTLSFCALVLLLNQFSHAADPPTAATTPDLESITEADPAAEANDGNAGEIAEQNLFVIVHQGGLLLYPILFASFILLLFVFERLISLRRRRVIPRPFVRQFLHQLRERSMDQEEALAMCRKNGCNKSRNMAKQ